MVIDSIAAAESRVSVSKAQAQPEDSVSKNIQDQISDVQRQKQALSSKEDLSVEERMKKRKELQQEISSLNVKLKRRQEELKKEQQKEALRSEELQKQSMADGVKEKNTEKIGAKDEEDENQEEESLRPDLQSVSEAGATLELTGQQERIIARMESGVVILRGEIRQDKARGQNVDKKESELARQEKKLRDASEFQKKADEREQAALRSANDSRNKNQEVQQFHVSII